MEWEREGLLPPVVFEKFAAANMLVPTLPSPLPVEWLKKLGVHDILGVVKVEEWDYLHTAIYTDEVRFLDPSMDRADHDRWQDPVSLDLGHL